MSVSRDVTTRFKVSPAALKASSWECAYSFIVRLASLWPIHAAITATGTTCRCINVAQVCRAACSLMCRIPAASTASRQYRDSTPGAYGCPIHCSLRNPTSRRSHRGPAARQLGAPWLTSRRSRAGREGAASAAKSQTWDRFRLNGPPPPPCLWVIARVFLLRSTSDHRRPAISPRRNPHSASSQAWLSRSSEIAANSF